MPEELLDLARRYKFTFGDHKSLQKEVIELKKNIRASVSKHLRMKQGYVQMQVFFLVTLIIIIIWRVQKRAVAAARKITFNRRRKSFISLLCFLL